MRNKVKKSTTPSSEVRTDSPNKASFASLAIIAELLGTSAILLRDVVRTIADLPDDPYSDQAFRIANLAATAAKQLAEGPEVDTEVTAFYDLLTEDLEPLLSRFEQELDCYYNGKDTVQSDERDPEERLSFGDRIRIKGLGTI